MVTYVSRLEWRDTQEHVPWASTGSPVPSGPEGLRFGL